MPLIAQLKATADTRIDAFYRRTCQLQAYVAVPFYAGIVAVLPAVSWVWLGRVEPQFMVFSLLLTCGWFLNGFVNPAYFAWLGLGRPGWNTVAHGVMAALNVLLGAVVLVSFHRERGLPLREGWPKHAGPLGAACLVGIAVAWALTAALEDKTSPVVSLAIVALAFGAIIALPAW